MANDAARYRAHAEEFRLALELGITPAEARKRIAGIAARERHRAAADRLATKMNAPLGRPEDTRPADQNGGTARNEPWMLRD